MTIQDLRLVNVTVENPPAWIPSPNYLVNITSDTGANDTIIDVAPSGMSGSIQAALQGWNSGIIIQELGQYGTLFYHGSGHNNYNGNEIYAYDLETRTWSRFWGPSSNLTTPSNVVTFNEYVEYANFAPAGCHTYDNIVAVPPTVAYPDGRIVLTGRAFAGWTGSYTSSYSSIFDIRTKTWSRSTNALAGMGEPTTSSFYDPVNECIWRFGSQSSFSKICRFDLDTHTWDNPETISETGSDYVYYDVVSGYCTKFDVVVQRITYGSFNQIRVYDPATKQRKVVTTTGTGPSRTDFTGIEWCPDTEKFYCYKAGSSFVWVLTPPSSNPLTSSWAWSTEMFNPSSASPSYVASSSNDELSTNTRNNRWRYVNSLKCFAWYDNVSGATQLYKPIGA